MIGSARPLVQTLEGNIDKDKNEQRTELQPGFIETYQKEDTDLIADLDKVPSCFVIYLCGFIQGFRAGVQ